MQNDYILNLINLVLKLDGTKRVYFQFQKKYLVMESFFFGSIQSFISRLNKVFFRQLKILKLIKKFEMKNRNFFFIQKFELFLSLHVICQFISLRGGN